MIVSIKGPKGYAYKDIKPVSIHHAGGKTWIMDKYKEEYEIFDMSFADCCREQNFVIPEQHGQYCEGCHTRRQAGQLGLMQHLQDG